LKHSRKRAITRMVIITTFVILMLSTFPSSTIYDMNQEEPTDATAILEEDTVEIKQESVLFPIEDATPAAVTWHSSGMNTLASEPWGSADYPSRLSEDDGSLCRMSEEADGTNWRFDLRFRTGAIYAHRYLTHELRMDFTQIWSLTPEDLKFYVALGTASGAEGSYTYVGQLSGPGLYTFSLDSAILFDPSITSTRFVYVRILGAIESSDPANGNVWDFDLLQISYVNFAPRLMSADADKIEDDVIYARLGASGNNYASITIEAECWDGSETWESITLRYEQGSNYWQAGWNWWTLPFTQPDTTFSGNVDWVTYIDGTFSFTSTTIIVTWNIRFNWNHPLDTGMVLTLSTHATSVFGNNDPTVLDLPWHIETGLDMAVTPYIDEPRVRTGETCSFSGDIEYSGSSNHWSPLSSEVDIQVQRTSPQSSGWIYTAQPASDGTFMVNPNTSSTSGTNTFELQVVADGTTTNLLTSAYSDTVIGDRVVVSSGSIGSDNFNTAYVGGTRNTGETDTLFLELEWESSGTPITSATSVSWTSSENTLSMSYVSGRWEGNTYARSSVGEQTYNDLTVVINGTDFVVVTEPSYSVLWDAIEILTTIFQDGDDYVNIGDTIFIRVTAQLVYMGHALDPGKDTLYMNGVEMEDWGEYFRHTIYHSNPGQWTFSVDDLNALESTYGITKIAAGKPSISCIWDTFLVDLSVDDAHVSVDDIVRIWAHVVRAYDGSIFTDSMGTVTLRHTVSSDISMIYSSVDGMWYADVTQGSANKFTYFIHSILDSIEQIDTVGRSLKFDGIDDYVDCGSGSSLDLTSTLTLSTSFYGDGTDWGSGMYLLAKKDNYNAQYALYIHSDGTLRFIYQNFVIWEVILQSAISLRDWHHVTVTVSGKILNCWYDGVHVRKNSILPVTLVSFSSVPLYLGAQKAGPSTSYHFQGLISEVRIYDYVLSDTQCEELFRGRSPDNAGMRLHLGRTSVDTSISMWNDISLFGNVGTIHEACVTLGYLPLNYGDVVNPIWDGVIISITGPTSQTLSLGQNASGIFVSAIYAYDGQPFDGIFQLNNTLFSYITPGKRGYTVEIISGDSHGITAIILNDETYAIWMLQQTVLHLDALRPTIRVNTVYDPQVFCVDVYLTDSTMIPISGWVNLTIDGNEYDLYCDGIVNSVFYFTPMVSGAYTLEGIFEGDSDYNATETSIVLTANPREIVFVSDIPIEMNSMTSTPFGFLSAYDNVFQGDYEGVTYIRNFPINASFSIWWTLASDYGNPRTFTGTWNITSGEGFGSLTVPWDLDGNGWLNSADFICYFVINIDGLGIYENISLETQVNILQPLHVNLQVPSLVYSDQSTLTLELNPLFDPSFSENLDISTTLYFSDDNVTWIIIDMFTTSTFGFQSMNWTCTDTGTLFFKAETVSTDYYSNSVCYTSSESMKETTILTIERVGFFTYSDQGILTCLLTTDEGEPLSSYSVFLEILDGSWISIGSGLTNESGIVNILWVPSLPQGQYSIRARAGLADSLYYELPDEQSSLLHVLKETLELSIDDSSVAQGYLSAFVFDDEGNPMEGIPVSFFEAGSTEPLVTMTTDSEGCSRLETSLQGDVVMRASVTSTDYYYGASDEMVISYPLNLAPVLLGGVGFLSMVVAIAFIRKRKGGFLGSHRLSRLEPKPELDKALEEERELIPERRREEVERKIAELDGDVTDGDS